VKEQKGRISELSKWKQEQTSQYRVSTLVVTEEMEDWN